MLGYSHTRSQGQGGGRGVRDDKVWDSIIRIGLDLDDCMRPTDHAEDYP